MRKLAALAFALSSLALFAERDTAIYRGKLTSDLNANGNRIVGVASPSAPNDAANKAYVDAHAGAVDTNAVIDIANATIATNPVVVGKLDKTDGIGSISWNNGSLDANAATVSCGGGFTTPYDFQIKESPSAQPTHALSAKANRAESGHADEIATLDADGNPTRSGIAKTSVATKADLEGYLPLTGGELSGGLYAEQSIVSGTIIAALTLDTTDIRIGSPTYYLHNEDECLADANGKFAHETMISATDPTFSNAVLSVGINTNLVASIGELNDFIHGYGELGATSVGGLILALLGAAALLRKKTAKLDNSGNATDAFATDLLGKQVAIQKIDERLPIPISTKTASFTTESYKRFVVTVGGNMTVTLHTPTSGDAEIFECRFNGTSLSADASIAFDGATATTMDTDCGTVKAGKVALMSAFWNGATWDVNWKVEG